MNLKSRVLHWVEQVPRAKVSSYGRIALLASCTPRQVARVLAGLDPETHIPWHRIIRSDGKVAVHPNAGGSTEQYQRLISEGIPLDQGPVNWILWGWDPRREDE